MMIFLPECCCFSLGMKVPAIVEETNKALKDGMCVVIGLQTTGEVGINHILLKK